MGLLVELCGQLEEQPEQFERELEYRSGSLAPGPQSACDFNSAFRDDYPCRRELRPHNTEEPPLQWGSSYPHQNLSA